MKRSIATSSGGDPSDGLKRARDASVPSSSSISLETGGTAALIPPNLLTILHPHQRQAVDFLLHHLLPDHLPTSTSNHGDMKQRLLQTGAILADDMGTGKVSFSLLLTNHLIYCFTDLFDALLSTDASRYRNDLDNMSNINM